jgi:DNA-binding response OmpR family regulator
VLEAIADGPDLVLMDIEMPGMGGISVCRSIMDSKKTKPQVTFVSAHDDLETRLQAYSAGGTDYIWITMSRRLSVGSWR